MFSYVLFLCIALTFNYCAEIEKKYYDGIIIAVNHDEFKQIDYNSLKKNNTVIYDVKGVLGKLADRCL